VSGALAHPNGKKWSHIVNLAGVAVVDAQEDRPEESISTRTAVFGRSDGD